MISKARRVILGVGCALVAVIALIVFRTIDQSSGRRIPTPAAQRIEITKNITRPKVVPGSNHGVFLAADGTLWGIGNNVWGQTGNSTNRGRDRFQSHLRQLDGGTNFVDAAVAMTCTLGVRQDGTLWIWGRFGGLFWEAQTQFPARVGSGSNWSAVAMTPMTALIQQRDGSLWVWNNGNSALGSLGSDPQLEPLSQDKDWSQFFVGFDSSLGVKTNGSLWAWGRLVSRVRDPFGTGPVSAPVEIGLSRDWVKAMQYRWLIIAEKRDGSLWTVDPTQTADRDSWIRVEHVAGGLRDWTVSSGGHAKILLQGKDGRLWGMGSNSRGQLAHRFFSEYDTWVEIGSNFGEVETMGIEEAGMALTRSGELWFWGFRYDDPGGVSARELKDRVGLLLSRWFPSMRPNETFQIPSWEVTPWKAAYVVGTNGVAATR